jgi:hypothetical protein
MTLSIYVAGVILVLLVAVAIRRRRSRRPAARRGASIGPAAVGTVYELLNEDRRNAIEIIVEDRAAYRDPEDAEGDLPKLEKP